MMNEKSVYSKCTCDYIVGIVMHVYTPYHVSKSFESSFSISLSNSLIYLERIEVYSENELNLKSSSGKVTCTTL